jgi:hypothetical protein
MALFIVDFNLDTELPSRSNHSSGTNNLATTHESFPCASFIEAAHAAVIGQEL